ncbi:hypothetical protein M9Y10_020818 [Tritrichomonas musculus]|uniref:Protein kinase domain-containing protein n=1 Tax=Tritrichomonas musculus TaxID=1915356 RepID=A0ABR2HER3_9EUKA
MSSRSKKRSSDYLIDLNDYEIVRNINRGGFAVINLVRNKKTGEEFAAKTNLIQNKSQNKIFISRETANRENGADNPRTGRRDFISENRNFEREEGERRPDIRPCDRAIVIEERSGSKDFVT